MSFSRTYGSVNSSVGFSFSSQSSQADTADDTAAADDFPPKHTPRRKRTSSLANDPVNPPSKPVSGTLQRELGENRRHLEQLKYALDGAESSAWPLRRDSMSELARFCGQAAFVDALRISGDLLPRTLAVVRQCIVVGSGRVDLAALGTAVALRLVAGDAAIGDLPEFVRVLVALQCSPLDSTPNNTQPSLGASGDGEPTLPPVAAVKKRRSFVNSAKVAVAASESRAAANEGDVDEARQVLVASVDACAALAPHAAVLRALPLGELLPRLGTLLLCQTGSRLEAGAVRDVMRECGALTSMASEWQRAVRCVTRRQPCAVSALELCAFFECTTFDNVFNQNELLMAPDFVAGTTALLRFLDDDGDGGGDDDELLQACLRVLLNVSNHNELGAQMLLDDAPLVVLLLRRLSLAAFDKTIQIVALLINCVETSAERCRTLLATALPAGGEPSVLALLVRLFRSIDAEASADAEQTPRRVLQSYVVLLLGCLCRAGDGVRRQLEAMFPVSSDGSSGLIPLARLLESFLSFQLSNGILTHDLYEQATLVARRLRSGNEDEDDN